MAGLSMFTLLLLLAWVAHRSRGYVIVNSVSWAIANQEETVSTEDDEEEDGNVLPNRLFQSGGSSIWKASYPASASAYQQRQPRRRGDSEGESRAVAAEMPSHREALGFPSRMFSYRRDGQSVERSPPKQAQQGKARLARHLLRSSTWGFLATLSTLDKILRRPFLGLGLSGRTVDVITAAWRDSTKQQYISHIKKLEVFCLQSNISYHTIKGLPFGDIFMISDGSPDNSTGAPFFYVSRQDRIVEDLMNNSSVSLTLSEAEPNYCRQNLINPEDPRCSRLTLTGQMVTVPSDEIEFAKQAMFSRHPVMKKWPPEHNWLFMKMNIRHVCLQNWFGVVAVISVEDYFEANPMNIV